MIFVRTSAPFWNHSVFVILSQIVETILPAASKSEPIKERIPLTSDSRIFAPSASQSVAKIVSTRAPTRSSAASIRSGSASIKPSAIARVSSIAASTRSGRLSSKPCVRAFKSVIAHSMICGRLSRIAVTRFSIMMGAASMITGTAAIRPSTRPVSSASAASIRALIFSVLRRPSTNCKTASTAAGISVGASFARLSARAVMISRAASARSPRMEPSPLTKTLPISIALSTSVFLFLSRPEIKLLMTLTPMSINFGSSLVILRRTSESTSPAAETRPSRPFSLSASESCPTSSVANWTVSRSGACRFSYTPMPSPSRADFIIVISPCRLSSCVSAMFCMAPALSSIAAARLSNSSPQPARRACADFKSTLLKISLRTFVFSPSVMPDSAESRSRKTSLSGRILPAAS